MRSISFKRLLSLAVIAFAVPFLALTLISVARATELAHSAQDELLLIALALGGATASIVNGFGKRTSNARHVGPRRTGKVERRGPRSSMMNLGY